MPCLHQKIICYVSYLITNLITDMVTKNYKDIDISILTLRRCKKIYFSIKRILYIVILQLKPNRGVVNK